ncbi:MAG: ribose-phosphate pyrophosphokinase [Lachnospiraceae bacterium]|nr:ribose-phosphate pyrophosphokinase [Lachnospiraceae bacterium]
MIKVNERVVTTEYFPDRTQRLKADSDCSNIEISWKYESDAELFTVIALARSYMNKGCKVSLKIPYIPNARMDRVKSDEEVFTLKVFCELINQVGFETVTVLDAHSNVSLALIDRVRQMNIANVIRKCSIDKLPKDIILYFPDEGSQKRYVDLFPEYRYVCGMKKRDWATGQIKGLDVIDNGVDLEGKTVLMIDDIVSYGGSLYYSALKLKELGVKSIFAYATHTENSVLDTKKGKLKLLLEDGTVEKLFTTDSLFTGEHNCIEVTEV